VFLSGFGQLETLAVLGTGGCEVAISILRLRE
jgi:hypothetical protein